MLTHVDVQKEQQDMGPERDRWYIEGQGYRSAYTCRMLPLSYFKRDITKNKEALQPCRDGLKLVCVLPGGSVVLSHPYQHRPCGNMPQLDGAHLSCWHTAARQDVYDL